MRRQISSKWTIVMKTVPPAVFGSVTIVLWSALLYDSSKRSIGTWMFLAVLSATTILYIWWSYALVTVQVDEGSLYVGRWRKEVRVPFSEISYVSDYVGGYPVIVHLKSPSNLGRRIVFMAPWNPFLVSSHPIVQELNALIRTDRKIRNSVKPG